MTITTSKQLAEARTVVAFSGGKDSTALALGLMERNERFDLLFTATGDELPELEDHIAKVSSRVGAQVIRPPAPTLFELIEQFEALPNWRQRWCTRMIKILPCIAWVKSQPGPVVLCVGLRADEESRKGLYDELVIPRYPLREWGMRIDDVRSACNKAGLTPPARTDCALCYGQQLREWWSLWKRHPDRFQRGVDLEAKYRHTFRSPSRDTWPAALRDLRAIFESGRRPRGLKEDGADEACRVCRW